jgi:HAD superfamily hydrolase (TIGR01549 family)
MINWSKIHVVVFDLDGTLYTQDQVRMLMFLEILIFCVTSFGEIKKIFIVLYFRKIYETLAIIRKPNAYQVAINKTALKYNLNIVSINEILEEWLIIRPLKYIRKYQVEGLHTTFKNLNKLGIKTVILSNYPSEKKINALGLCPDLQVSPISNKLIYVKPHPNGINLILSTLNLKRDNLLMIGDRLEHDGACAHESNVKFLQKKNNKFFLHLNSTFK